jgi:hypothetical protein
VAHLSAEYAIYALLVQPNSLPAGEVLGWLESWVWILAPGCIVLSLLMFPNGHLPSRGWRWIAWLSVLLTIGGAVWVALSPGVIGGLGSIRNPLGIEGLPSAYKPAQTIIFALLLVAGVHSTLASTFFALGAKASNLPGGATTLMITVWPLTSTITYRSFPVPEGWANIGPPPVG